MATGTVIQRKTAAERATEAQKFARTDEEDSEIGRNRHVMYNVYTETDSEIAPGVTINDFFDNEEDEGRGNITGAVVLLSREGKSQRAKVIGRKRDSEGNFIGTSPTDTQYVVEFPDGTQVAHEYTALLDAIYCQVDEDGKKWYMFKDIIGHRYRNRGGRGLTKGWFLQVEWQDGKETTWETLSSLKESNPYHVAIYA